MFSVPYVIFLGIYLVIVLAILVFAFFSLYHLLRFGFRTTVNVGMTFVLIAGTILILFVSYRSLQQIDWTASIEFELPFESITPFWNL